MPAGPHQDFSARKSSQTRVTGSNFAGLSGRFTSWGSKTECTEKAKWNLFAEVSVERLLLGSPDPSTVEASTDVLGRCIHLFASVPG